MRDQMAIITGPLLVLLVVLLMSLPLYLSPPLQVWFCECKRLQREDDCCWGKEQQEGGKKRPVKMEWLL